MDTISVNTYMTCQVLLYDWCLCGVIVMSVGSVFRLFNELCYECWLT